MGNKRKVWLACGAAVGLPLTGFAQDVRQVQVTKADGHVEIHVLGTNLSKPTDVSWKKFAYTLEWKAGLQSPGRRIRVESGPVKSVAYGWFKANPRTMRVQINCSKALKPQIGKEKGGWVVKLSDETAQIVKVNKPSETDLGNDLWTASANDFATGNYVSVEPLHDQAPVKELTKPMVKPVQKPAPDHKAAPAKPLAKAVTTEPFAKVQPAAKQLLVAKSFANTVLTVEASAPEQHLRHVTLDVSNAELSQVLKGLAMQSGANIVIGPSVTGKVTADLHDVTIDQALKYISYLTGVKYEKADGIYMFGTMPQQHVAEHTDSGPSTVKVVPILSDAQQQVRQALEARFRGQELQVLTPDEAKKAANDSSTQSVVSTAGGTKSLVMPESYLILIGPEDLIGEAERVARAVDADIVRAHASYERTDRIDREIRAYDVKYADPRALREALISEIPGLRAVIAPNSVGTFNVYQEGRSKRQANEDNSQASASNGGTNNGGSNAAATQGTGSVGSVSTQQANDATLEQPFTQEENSAVPMRMLLRGTHEQVLQAMDYLTMLDTPPHQVALELRVMELTKTDAIKAGIDWNILTGGAVKVLNLNNSIANPSNSASISLSGNNFNGDVTASLDAIADKNRLIARPNVIAMDGRQSEIFIGDIVRYVESITQSQNGTTVTTGEVPVGVRLSVLPRIGADGNMTLDLRPRISLLTSFTPVPGGGQLPQTSSRFAQSTVSLQSGQTLAIGGLIQDQDVKTLSGIPLLMNLPFIGSLFRSTSISKDRKELVIFLTARAINGPVGAEALPMMKDSHFRGGVENNERNH